LFIAFQCRQSEFCSYKKLFPKTNLTFKYDPTLRLVSTSPSHTFVTRFWTLGTEMNFKHEPCRARVILSSYRILQGLDTQWSQSKLSSRSGYCGDRWASVPFSSKECSRIGRLLFGTRRYARRSWQARFCSEAGPRQIYLNKYLLLYSTADLTRIIRLSTWLS